MMMRAAAGMTVALLIAFGGNAFGQGAGGVIPIGESRPGTVRIGETRPGTTQIEPDRDLQSKHKAAFPEEVWKPAPAAVDPGQVTMPLPAQDAPSSGETGVTLVTTVDVSNVSASMAESDDGRLVLRIRTGNGTPSFEALNGRMRSWMCGDNIEVQGRLSRFDNRRCVVVTAYGTEESIPVRVLSEQDARTVGFLVSACREELKRSRGKR
jgi:hypothetical protein